MNNLTNKELIQLGAAANKLMVQRLHSNGMGREDIAKFTGLTERTVDRIMRELNIE